MQRYRPFLIIVVAAALVGAACSNRAQSNGQGSAALKALVKPIKTSVVTVINYDLNGDVASIGSGFFIASNGVLLTNFHVLDGAYHAEIKTSDGERFPVSAVMAKSQVIDLIKVRVDIPSRLVTPVVLAAQAPEVADSIFVVGSPMGLEQTVSEGIVSAIRELPGGGQILQLTAPISQGSSGGPVINGQGQAVGVVTFQAARGQNLNFAISIGALDMLFEEAAEPSIAEWTIRNSRQGPALAATLCGKGSGLTIQGEYEEALTYFRKAAEANPDDPDAWYGLGSCYVGLDQPDNAVAAYKRPIELDPDNAVAHFILAMYYKSTGDYEAVIPPLREVIRIDPSNVRARFELGRAYGELNRTPEQIDAFETILVDDPEHLPTLLNLGSTLGSVGRFEEAMTLFNRANALEPDNEVIYYNMGVTYNRMEMPDAAVRAYTRAIRINPRMAEAHYNLGMTYLKQGRRKLALDEYEILRDLNADAASKLFEGIYPDQ